MECKECKKVFTRKDNLVRHIKTKCKTAKHIQLPSNEIFCQPCQKNCSARAWSSHLRSNLHKENTSSKREDGVDIINSAFQERIVSYRVRALEFYINIVLFLNDYTPKIIRLIKYELEKHHCIKLNLELYGFYYCGKTGLYEVKSFNTQFQIVCKSSNLEEILSQFYATIDRKADELAERESGEAYLHFNNYLQFLSIFPFAYF